MNELALFAGAGGGILGGKLLGWRTVCAVEWEPYPASVLAQRQNDGILPPFPIWDDVRTFDGRPWEGRVDVVSGGFPCQDISIAGGGVGLTVSVQDCGQKWPESLAKYDRSTSLWRTAQHSLFGDLEEFSGIWPRWGSMRSGESWQRDTPGHLTSETGSGLWLTPRVVEVDETPENFRRRMNSKRANDRKNGYGNLTMQVKATSVKTWPTPMASDATRGPTTPERNAKKLGGGISSVSSETLADSNSERLQEFNASTESNQARQYPRRITEGWGETWWATEPSVGRLAHGVASRMDELKALGNGQVPGVVRLAWRILNAHRSS
jgi:DNA (cytosine-5)-methyltransferase 1